MSSQKHTYKLYYFDSRGRAEPIRLMFHYLGVDFEDVRMSMEEFAESKDKAPMRQLPYLEMDGGKTVLCQTLTICRYLAKSINPDRWFGGATKTDSAKVDMFADAFADIFNFAMSAVYAPTHVKDEMLANFSATIRDRLKTQENLLRRSRGEFFVGKTPHWCDIYILGVLEALDQLEDGLLDELHILREYYLRMRNLPELKEYIDQNWPPTKYQS
ncbi:unnamed protein product [Caenorhabditis bovis]|uniref:Glutathione S-transferase n=1 Tax=Caenorhabditis bovis TaxID=2654633 RepID=A0A8S1EXT5_9PELO|nr:unnamed protein product [Caenorhabditis bovis]